MTETTDDTSRQPLSFWQKIMRRKLRNYLFLNKRLQLNFALLLVIVGIFNAAYFSALFYFYTRESFIRLTAYVPEYLLTDNMFRESYKLFIWTVVFVMVGEGIFVALLGLFFSHRVAGPIYAVSQKLKAIAQGTIPEKLTLRKNDFLEDFADEMNLTIATLETRRAELQGALAALEAGKSQEAKEKLAKLV